MWSITPAAWWYFALAAMVNAEGAAKTLKDAEDPTPELREELRQHVAAVIGPIARPDDVRFADTLPKTRSGKIMRRLLRSRALGMPEGDLSTLEE